MTDTEQKALALIAPGATCEVNLENVSILATALCRAIEQHEAFRQEVSDAVDDMVQRTGSNHGLYRFLLPKPVDPLVEAAKRAWPDISAFQIEQFREAFEHFGYEIREKAGD